MWSFLGFTALQCLRCPFFSAPSASKNFFPQQLFSPLPNSLHCITFNDFLTSPLKQTRKPPSHPHPSPHTFPLPFFPCPKEYLHRYCQLSFIKFPLLLPHRFLFISFSCFPFSLCFCALYPFPVSLQPACTVKSVLQNAVLMFFFIECGEFLLLMSAKFMQLVWWMCILMSTG